MARRVVRFDLLALFVSALGLVACSLYDSEAVYLRHPETGQVAQCGPYNGLWEGPGIALERETKCIDDFRSQGYERLPGKPPGLN